MKIINLSEEEVLNGIKSKEGDYYRVFSEYDENDMLGLYYKELSSQYTNSLDEIIEVNKFCWNQEYTWEHYRMNRLFSLVNRLEEVYKKIGETSELKSPVITGIALYNNYPVGTLFPKKLLDYRNALDILDNKKISYDDELMILNSVKYLLDRLMERDVYATGLYGGNVVVNPNDYSDVRLDGLDGPAVVRIETKEYVKTLKKKGWDLRADTFRTLDRIRSK